MDTTCYNQPPVAHVLPQAAVEILTNAAREAFSDKAEASLIIDNAICRIKRKFPMYFKE
jgi:hypothetical protein